MSHSLADVTQALLNAAKSAGADQADAVAVDGTSLSISVRDGALEQAERSEGIEFGLRVIVGQKQACVSASDISAATLAQAAERAVAMAGQAPDDPHIRLAEPGEFLAGANNDALKLSDPSGEPEAPALQETALEAEAAAMAVQGVSQVQAATAAYGKRQIHLATSLGFQGGYQRTDNVISCVAISGAGDQMERDYDGDYRVFRSDLRSANDIGTLAAERAIASQGARKPPTGSFPVLYDERVASSLIGHVLGATNGGSVARGSTWLRDAMGEMILPDWMDIIEDPHRVAMSSSRFFDGEGLPTQVRKIVEGGVLQDWTMDLSTASRLGLTSTASAMRGTSSPPSPGNSNIAVTQGDKTPAQLMADMGTGLFLTSLIGSSINPTTGDYSRGASGFWIENGEIQYPVNECTIAGNLNDMLRTIVPSNDAKTYKSHVVPSILVEGLTLAGA